MINYPPTLPLPLLSTLTFKEQSNLLRGESVNGIAQQRRRFFSTPTSMACSWVLKSEQAQAFEQFHDVELQNNAWFMMDIHTPIGVLPHQVRFVTSPLENYKPLGARKWSYSATLEIKDRQKISLEDYEVIINFGDAEEFIAMAEELHQTVNYDYPAIVQS